MLVSEPLAGLAEICYFFLLDCFNEGIDIFEVYFGYVLLGELIEFSVDCLNEAM